MLCTWTCILTSFDLQGVLGFVEELAFENGELGGTAEFHAAAHGGGARAWLLSWRRLDEFGPRNQQDFAKVEWITWCQRCLQVPEWPAEVSYATDFDACQPHVFNVFVSLPTRK